MRSIPLGASPWFEQRVLALRRAGVRVFVLRPARGYLEAFRAAQRTACTSRDFSSLKPLPFITEAQEQPPLASKSLSLAPGNKGLDFPLRGMKFLRVKQVY